ncbi:hypothetical protein ACOQFL_14320 [Actinopolyspora sp. H202]|uniref:hypothetical protein n=1 Tax=Actinopolyspora sp. H202 TaxID=1500456 RepID=UPI003EE533EB
MTLRGTLPLSVADGTAEEERDDASAELLAAVDAARAGNVDLEGLMRAFRRAVLAVEVIPAAAGHTLRQVWYEGLCWLPVFSDLRQLAGFFHEAGWTEEVDYGLLSGAELIDECLPQLPHGTAIMLDAVGERPFSLPPVAGMVPESLAVATPEEERSR